MTASCFLPAAAVLAEGPVWHEGRLYWVDIERGEIHRSDPELAADESWRFPHRLGFVLPTVRGDFVVGADRSLARFDPISGRFQPWGCPEGEPEGNRFNDAKCDPAGRLWAGTMAVRETPGCGALFRVDAGPRFNRVVTSVSISNGLAWSPDGRQLYYIDSPLRRVDAFEFDPAHGTISGRRTIIEFAEGEGFPDGMAADAAGNLWIALWGGWRVVCHDPRSGRRLAEVSVPVEAVTSCCFGDGDRLYITTASRDLDAAGRERQPLAGGLFEVRVGVEGGPVARFNG